MDVEASPAGCAHVGRHYISPRNLAIFQYRHTINDPNLRFLLTDYIFVIRRKRVGCDEHRDNQRARGERAAAAAIGPD